MKKKYWLFVVFLTGSIFFVEYDLARRMNSKLLATAPKVNSALSPTNSKSEPKATVKMANIQGTQSIFDSQFVAEAQKMSQLQENSKAVDEKIDSLAKAMNSYEMKKLSVMIESKSADGDQRAMAVELLARSKSEEAMQILNDFVLTHETGAVQTWNRNREFESVLRAQAIEGIAAYPKKDVALSYLSSLANKVDESFLKDRIARSEENLKGHAPTSQQQDDAALKQLVQ